LRGESKKKLDGVSKKRERKGVPASLYTGQIPRQKRSTKSICDIRKRDEDP